MRTNQPFRPLKSTEWAIAVAKLSYEKWQAKMNVPPEKRVKFEDDLMDYLCNGFVVSHPTVFNMMKIINISENHKPKLAWFIRMGVGDLRDLLNTLPGRLPYIAFCRRGDPRIRVYSTERLWRLAFKVGGQTVERSIGKLIEMGDEKCTKSNAG